MIFFSAVVQYIYTRKIQFFDNGYYHVYNRGVDKRTVFLRFGHYLRFQQTIRSILNTGSATERRFYNQGQALKEKVSLLTYCLMPNHFHFLIKQHTQGGISEFMQKLSTSYTMYFNLNLHRSGHLFEHAFKAKMITDEPTFLHVHRYIHMNPVVAHLVEQPGQWRWSSYQEYCNPEIQTLCDHEEIASFFPTIQKYQAFIESVDAIKQLTYQATLQKDQDEDALYL